MARRVVFAPEAASDLGTMHAWIAEQASADVANAWLARIEGFCRGLALTPLRGRLRPDVRPGLRVGTFERRVTVAWIVDEDRVTILRVFSRGRDWERSWS